jgi:hypothetical protein
VTRSRNHSRFGKAKGFTYAESVCVVLVTQHAERMLHIILSLKCYVNRQTQAYRYNIFVQNCTTGRHLRYYTAMWPVRFYQIFPLYLTKGTILGEKSLLNLKYMF